MSDIGIKANFIKENSSRIEDVLNLVENIVEGAYPIRGIKVFIDKCPNGEIGITCMYSVFDTHYSMIMREDDSIEFGLAKLSWWNCQTEQDMEDCLCSIERGVQKLHKKLNKPKFVPLLDRLKIWMRSYD